MKNETRTGRDKYGVDFSESYLDSCSAHDCTGLIPTPPQSSAELESYEEVYSYLPKAKASNAKGIGPDIPER